MSSWDLKRIHLPSTCSLAEEFQTGSIWCKCWICLKEIPSLIEGEPRITLIIEPSKFSLELTIVLINCFFSSFNIPSQITKDLYLFSLSFVLR